MPISDTGYRHWNGKRSGRFWRSVSIARHGINMAMKKRGLLVVVFLSVIPAFIMGIVIYQAAELLNGEGADAFLKAINGIPYSSNEWKDLVGNTPDIPTVWRVVFAKFLMWQLLPIAVLIAWVGPWLISRDMRVKALQLYFSRPLSRTDYVIGKFMVVGTFVGMITVLPGLLLYLIGVLLARSIDVVANTWTIPVLLIAASAMITLVSGAIVLACSSLTRRTGMAASAWVSIVILSHVASKLFAEATGQNWAHLVSLWGNARQLLSWMFDVTPEFGKVVSMSKGAPPQFVFGGGWSAVILAAVFVASLVVLTWRIRMVEGEH